MDPIFIVLIAGAFFCFFSFSVLIINLIKVRINCDPGNKDE